MHTYLKKSALYCSFIVAALFITSCLSNTGTEFPSQVQVGLQIQNMDSTLTMGDDSIKVTSVQLLHGNSYFKIDDDSLFLTPQVQLVPFNPNASQYRNPQLLISGILKPGLYQSLTFKMPRPPEDDNNQYPDEFTNGGLYSMIVEGSYNDEFFTYKSTKAYSRSFGFNPNLQVTETNQQYSFLVKTDIGDWFLGNQGFYDPRNSDNGQQINLNIERSIQLENQSEF